jgi:hypothetical protein
MENKSVPSNPLPDHPLPPEDFLTRTLPTVLCLKKLYRLNPKDYQSALYFDKSGKGRFDSPTQGYGILYLGEDEYASFIECFGRVHGVKTIEELTLKKRNLFSITASRPLTLVDLTGSDLVKLGADARLSSGDYRIARSWIKEIWGHPQKVDGIRYLSRHDPSRVCCGLFDRSQSYLREQNLGNLVDNHPLLLSEILTTYDYSLI